LAIATIFVAKATSKVANATKELTRVQALEDRFGAIATVWAVVHSAIIRVTGQKDLTAMFGLIAAGPTVIQLSRPELEIITGEMTRRPYAFDSWVWSEYMEKVAVGNQATLDKQWSKWLTQLYDGYSESKKAYENLLDLDRRSKISPKP